MDPCSPVSIAAHDGARITVLPHGAHLTSWIPAIGDERLWMSRASGCGAGVAVRGGVPVVWPQFSDRGALPKHGFVRDRAWSLRHAEVAADGAAEAALDLAVGKAAVPGWTGRAALALTVRAAGPAVSLTLEITNEGPEEFHFMVALHAYLVVRDLGSVAVTGLGGAAAEDNADGRRPVTLPAGPFTVTGPVDLAVRDVPGPVVLHEPGRADLVVERHGLPDLVVWNPGTGRAPADVHPGGEGEFVCLEPARLDPVVLPPGGSWSAAAVLRVAPTG